MISLNFKEGLSGIFERDFLDLSRKIKPFLGRVEERNQAFSTILDDEKLLDEVEEWVKKVPSKFKNFIILGVGGSGLGFKTIHQAFHHISDKKFYVLDNVDPTKIKEVTDQLDLTETFFLIITKSGKTPETMAQYFYFKDLILEKKLNQSDHFLFITDKNSYLDKLGEKLAVERFYIPSNLGGRFSVLSAVGLIPAKILGIDIRAMVKGAKDVRTRFESLDFSENIVFQLAALQYLHHEQGITQQVIFPYSEQLKFLGEWFVQLVAESTGKENKHGVSVGVTPLVAIGARDQHSSLQLFSDGPKDKLFIFLKVKKFGVDMLISKEKLDPDFKFLEGITFGELINAEIDGTKAALIEKDCHLVSLEIDRVDEYNLGAIFFLFKGATAFLAEFLKINAFDQPGVERSKMITKVLLENK